MRIIFFSVLTILFQFMNGVINIYDFNEYISFDDSELFSNSEIGKLGDANTNVKVHDTCDVCQDTVVILINILKQQSDLTKVIEEFTATCKKASDTNQEKEICPTLTYHTVIQFKKVILRRLIHTQSLICLAADTCDSQGPPRQLEVKYAEVFPSISDLSGNNECKLCTNVVEKFYKVFTNNAVQDEWLNDVTNFYCSQLSSNDTRIRPMCELFIAKYSTDVFTWMGKKLEDSIFLCLEADLCNGQKVLGNGSKDFKICSNSTCLIGLLLSFIWVVFIK